MPQLGIEDAQHYYASSADSLGWGVHSGGLIPERAALLDEVIVGRRVLDIGCAHGVYVDYLAAKGIEAVGMDLVSEFLEQALEADRDGAYVLGDALHLPFAEASFDTVLLSDVLEHLEDESQAVAELVRVARKRIIVIVPRATDEFLEQNGLVFRHHLDRTHLRTYTPASLSERFANCSVTVRLLDGRSLKSAFLCGMRRGIPRRLLGTILRRVDVVIHSELLAVVDVKRASQP
jgi:2-polyprenyl-3-methyl-5-hydroxy-6-metoxy-1,4-benzoquinol methylase